MAGGTILHWVWVAGAEGWGALLTGDIVQVVPERRYFSFMYSYPNHIPMSAVVNQSLQTVESFEYDRIHGAWWDYTVIEDAKGAIVPSGTAYGIAHSAVRYLGAIKGEWQPAIAP